jgi:hypothetical protein
MMTGGFHWTHRVTSGVTISGPEQPTAGPHAADVHKHRARGRIRTFGRRIRRVTDDADQAFYLLLCLQLISLRLLWLPW